MKTQHSKTPRQASTGAAQPAPTATPCKHQLPQPNLLEETTGLTVVPHNNTAAASVTVCYLAQG